MNAKEVLAIKGTILYTAGEQSPILELIKTMAEFNIGSIVIVDKGAVSGIVTFSEIIQIIANKPDQLSSLKAKDVLKKVDLCDPNMSVEDLSQLMIRNKIRYLPVVDKGILLGVLSFHDVSKAMLEWQVYENDQLRRYITS